MNSNMKLFSILLVSLCFKIDCELNLSINKTKSVDDKYDTYNKETPLVITISSEDKFEKIKNVDLICIVGYQHSMVSHTLSLLVNKMQDEDKLALIILHTKPIILHKLTHMTSANKTLILKSIDDFYHYDEFRENYLSGLEEGLKFLENNYTSGDRIASIIFFGKDKESSINIDNYKLLLKNTNKSDYAFTINTFCYGFYCNCESLYELSKIKDGNFFYIEDNQQINDIVMKLYGSLSTVAYVNVKLIFQSNNCQLRKLYGEEEMYEIYKNINRIETTLIHLFYGKKYSFVLFVRIPENITLGVELLNATIYPLGISAKYLWSYENSSSAYDEYLRYKIDYYYSTARGSITSTAYYYLRLCSSFVKREDYGSKYWDSKVNELITKYDQNYNIRTEFLFLALLRELRTTRISGYYNDNENSYSIGKIINIEKPYYLNITSLPKIIIIEERIIYIDTHINFFYFYLVEGTGDINSINFSGDGSTFIIFSSNENDTIKITPKSSSLEYYYYNETRFIMQANIEFGRPGKFISKNDLLLNYIQKWMVIMM